MQNEVIIDGCNVAECEFFDNKGDECLLRGYGKKHIMMFNCKHNPNCYFKQLQRAKAELEQYKKSKQASYESMQAEWNNAVNELRELKSENEKLKTLLENKEKAYNHLCNANSRKKEQIKNLNYMLFEEKEMTTKEWKLKYRLAYKERKFIQYKEITSKKLNNYKQTLEEIREIAKLINILIQKY